jgi:flagellar assembly factor FliW
MQISNRQFGMIEIDEKKILHLPEGLLAFEELKRYAIVESPELAPFQWLVAVDEPEVSFAVVSPIFARADFEAELSAEDKRALQTQPGDPLASLVIVNVTPGGVTANLRGPLVVNGRNRLARQIVLHRPDYRIDHPLSHIAGSEEGAADAMEGAHARTHSSTR